MEPHDVALIEALIDGENGSGNQELRRLWERHAALERELEGLRDRPHLTPAEAARDREIRKIKLAGRDRIETILRDHRRAAGQRDPGRHTD